MTQEEKARAYDKVSKEVKDFFEGKQKMYNDVTQTLEHLFPELKESEDEKVCKEIKQFIRSRGMQLAQSKVESWIAWLEKQAEQKPVEWDESIIDETISLINNLASGYGEKVDEPITFNGVKMINNIMERLRAIKPQPKQEWSQNDIEMIDWLIRSCEKEHEELCNDKYGHQDIVSDLKRDCRKKWDWLESLKNRVIPKNQWKPSDEQMEALADALSLAKNCGEESAFDLRTLHEQLKKLMEE